MLLNVKKILAILLIFGALFAGLQIYSGARSGDLPLHHWFAGMHILPTTDFLTLPAWLMYSLPDALWMFAMVLSILLVWNFRWCRESAFWFVLAGTLGVFFEIAQAVSLIPGTFDVLDLTLLVIAGLLPILFISTTHRHEKSV